MSEGSATQIGVWSSMPPLPSPPQATISHRPLAALVADGPAGRRSGGRERPSEWRISAESAHMSATHTQCLPCRARLVHHGCTMITDLDIYRSARVLIDQHGEDAPIWAAQKADAMLERGNLDGKLLWLKILEATKYLLSKERPPGATVQ